MLLVPIVLGFQQAAGGEVAREAALLQRAERNALRGGRVGNLQEQGRNLGAGKVPAVERPCDHIEPLALAADIERESVELRDLSIDFAFVASRPSARIARQQRRPSNPWPVLVAFDLSGCQAKQPEGRGLVLAVDP